MLMPVVFVGAYVAAQSFFIVTNFALLMTTGTLKDDYKAILPVEKKF